MGFLFQGKDKATGGFSNSLGDVDAQEPMANSTQMDFDIDLEELSKRKQVDYSSAMSTQSISHPKKKNKGALLLRRKIPFIRICLCKLEKLQ
ncbi:hypothetical protein CMV_018126 [Castanea mollissima]|uniref:Uncharacterized protein n=1 Tax=Castanea mollissima TaxID=60419 RepID=A0A8J4VGG7_9ROSI|nr:hypothetical protein CMV_018126 [Castanea mollissima]